VDASVSGYVMGASDYAFDAFLARCTPARVSRDLMSGMSAHEKSLQRFLVDKEAVELFVARSRAVRHEFTPEQEAVAARWAAKQIVKEK
jgi:hypothetical protein